MKTTGRILPQPPEGWTRRRFLRSLLLGMLAGASGACRYPGDGPGAGQPATPAWLGSIISAPESAGRLGRSYLANYPEEADADRLVAEIEAAVTASGGTLSAVTDADRMTAALQRLVRAEFARDQVASVSGWVLSRTEARLYALVSLDGETAVTAARKTTGIRLPAGS
jgi:hypothetical protein